MRLHQAAHGGVIIVSSAPYRISERGPALTLTLTTGARGPALSVGDGLLIADRVYLIEPDLTLTVIHPQHSTQPDIKPYILADIRRATECFVACPAANGNSLTYLQVTKKVLRDYITATPAPHFGSSTPWTLVGETFFWGAP
ncbi:hypothetical protein DRQ50_00005 [bacterium]|nr:MAG: hypothetical protein DRQ50_00005 [bacterium]